VQKEEEDALIKNNKKSGLTMKAGQDLCHNIACHQHMDMWNLEKKFDFLFLLKFNMVYTF
jgi:hypothetical protein